MTPSNQCEIAPCSKYVGTFYCSLSPSRQRKMPPQSQPTERWTGETSISGAERGLTSFGMVSSWEPVCAEASIPAADTAREAQSARGDGVKWKPEAAASAPFRLCTYLGSPGCYVQWGRGPAAWPAGVVWWAVGGERGRGEQRAHAENNERKYQGRWRGLRFCNGLSGASGRSDNGREKWNGMRHWWLRLNKRKRKCKTLFTQTVWNVHFA